MGRPSWTGLLCAQSLIKGDIKYNRIGLDNNMEPVFGLLLQVFVAVILFPYLWVCTSWSLWSSTKMRFISHERSYEHKYEIIWGVFLAAPYNFQLPNKKQFAANINKTCCFMKFSPQLNRTFLSGTENGDEQLKNTLFEITENERGRFRSVDGASDYSESSCANFIYLTIWWKFVIS